MMNAPFGIADYGDFGDSGKSALVPLPRVYATRTLNESQYALIEDGNGRLITTTYRHIVDTELDVDCPSEHELPRRSGRGIPGRETTAVRRRPTSVPRDIADAVMVALIGVRQRIPRARLARWLGLTPRQVHLAELGSVQPDALPTLAAYFGIDLRDRHDLPD